LVLLTKRIAGVNTYAGVPLRVVAGVTYKVIIMINSDNTMHLAVDNLRSTPYSNNTTSVAFTTPTVMGIGNSAGLGQINAHVANVRIRNDAQITDDYGDEWDADFGSMTSLSSRFMYRLDLNSFPLIDISKVTTFYNAWYICRSLSSFPANFFDATIATNFPSAFVHCGLSQTSVDNILISIAVGAAANNLNNVTLNMHGGTSATPSSAGLAAKDALVARGWTVTHN
jgi:hypothetical protein